MQEKLAAMAALSGLHLCDFCNQINVNTIVPYFPPDLGNGIVQVCLHHQPTYNALGDSSRGCGLCLLFNNALESKNARRQVAEAFKAHEKSQIWLVSGEEVCEDLSVPKGLHYLRVNVGNGTLLKEADFNITADHGRWVYNVCAVVRRLNLFR